MIYICLFLTALFHPKFDKRDDFNFDTVNFPFLIGGVQRRPSYGVYCDEIFPSFRLRYIIGSLLPPDQYLVNLYCLSLWLTNKNTRRIYGTVPFY